MKAPAALRVRVKHQRPLGAHIDLCDRIERELVGRPLVKGVHVHFVLDAGDRGRDALGAALQQVVPAREQGLVIHPHQAGEKLVGHAGG